MQLDVTPEEYYLDPSAHARAPRSPNADAMRSVLPLPSSHSPSGRRPQPSPATFAPVPNALVKKAAHVGITYAQYTAQVKGPLSHIVFEKVLTDSTDLGLSAKPPAPTRPSSTLTISAARRHRKSLPIAATFRWAWIYPKIKDAEKLVANSIFMENPSDEQFKKLRDDFVGYLRGRRVFNFELPTG